MAPQRHSRPQVASFLKEHGPVEDDGGRATTKLKTAVGYQGSPAGFSQLLSAMERSGEIERTTKGKRTYRIAIAGMPQDLSPDRTHDGGGTAELDYERLAEALLVRAAEAISTGARSNTDVDAWARRRIERLQRLNAELEQALSRAKAEARALAEQRDALAEQLEHTAGNLALLTDRMESRPSRERIAQRLGSDERRLLDQLRDKGSGRGAPRATAAPR